MKFSWANVFNLDKVKKILSSGKELKSMEEYCWIEEEVENNIAPFIRNVFYPLRVKCHHLSRSMPFIDTFQFGHV